MGQIQINAVLQMQQPEGCRTNTSADSSLESTTPGASFVSETPSGQRCRAIQQTQSEGATSTALLSQEETCKHTGGWRGHTQNWTFTGQDKPEGGCIYSRGNTSFSKPNTVKILNLETLRSACPFSVLGRWRREVLRFLSLLKLLNRASQRGTQGHEMIFWSKLKNLKDTEEMPRC